MAESPDPYTAPVGTKLSEEQRLELLRAAAGQQEPATAQETEVLYEETAEDDQNSQATDPVDDQGPNLKYPLTISENYPARIVFIAREVEGVDVVGKIGDAIDAVKELARETLFPELNASVGETRASPETKKELEESEQEIQEDFTTFVNTEGKKVGQVTLPLQRDLRFSDNADYEAPNLGVLGGALEGTLAGTNPFAGASNNGQIAPTVSALAAQVAAKVGPAAALGVAAATRAGPVAGGFTALGGASLLEGLAPGVRSATRITTAPNQRTLFQQVRIRSFSFTFKMIATNAREAQEIKDIVKFFRKELYPEKISLGETGIPLAYKFPNVFEIQIRNRFDKNPAFKIQRCYLRDVSTTFNSQASGMYSDGNFVEVDISLAFQEIVALDKEKIDKGGF